MFLAVALPGFGPAAATDQLRLYAVYLLAACGCMKRFNVWGVVFIFWAALSLLWSPDWMNGIRVVANLTAFLMAFMYLRHEDVTLGVIFGLVVIIASSIIYHIPAINGLVAEGIYGNPNFTAEFILIACGYLWWRLGATALCFIIPSGIFLMFQDTHLQWFVAGALLWGGFCYLFLRKKWEPYAYTTVMCFAALVMLWGWSSVMVRMELWTNAVQLFVPWGYGAGGLNYVYDTVRENHLSLFSSFATNDPTNFIGAVHNEYLQLLLEFGLPGVAIAGLFLRGIKPNACIVIAGLLALIGFPLQNPQTAILVAASLVIPAEEEFQAWIPAAMALAVYGAFMVTGSYYGGQVYALIYNNPIAAFRANVEAHRAFPFDHRWRRQLQLSLARMVVINYPKVRLSRDASDTVYEISSSAGPNNAAMLLRRAELLVNFGRALEAQPVLDRLNRYHPKMMDKIRIVKR